MARRTDHSDQLGLFDQGPARPAESPGGLEVDAPSVSDSGAPPDAPPRSEPTPDVPSETTPTAPTPPASQPSPRPVPPRRFVDGPLPDAAARERIRSDLETNLLVEAGAGSGKTTALVERMVALVATGTATVAEVAAVTFTRKAAAELRQRFQTALEEALSSARGAGDEEVTGRLDRALRDIHRGFTGTIHSFCARLLRERPIEAGLDPAFEELMGPEEIRLRHAFWRAWLERTAARDGEAVARIASVGLRPSQLRGLFDELVANPDVTFPAEPVEPPAAEDVATVRDRLDRLIDRGLALMPPEPDEEQGWDGLQSRIRFLAFLRRVVDWSDSTTFLEHLGEEFHGRSYGVVQKRWPDGKAAKALAGDWKDLRDGLAAEVLDRWWAHRYPVALGFARDAAAAFEEERRRSGRLNFQDLLMLAAALLRNHAGAREELGRRYRRVLVDEFQDTDPVQAEVLLLLASPPDDTPWQRVVPRPGALFVVGDPKQSIYRFRRADISVYNLVRDRFRAFGDVLELVANFRSLPPIGHLVDAVFGADGRFPATATEHQAAFAPLRTRRQAIPDRQGVFQYAIEPEGRAYSTAAADGAARLVPWIADQVAAGRSPGDFLVLARQKAELETYARALEAWSVPVQVTGAGVSRTEELVELLTLLEALEDPTDPVRVVAVLVGLLFGLDHDQLVEWAMDSDASRRRFDLTAATDDDGTPVGAALHTLHRWWERSRRLPADVLVGRIVDETGLVPLAAARELGGFRAGALLFALDVLRTAALHGDTSLTAGIEALRTAIAADEAEAPLEPVRRGVVRVMTLHQAKGLEAPVVALVHPVGSRNHDVTRHIERGADGSAIGHLVVQEREGHRVRIVARPSGWEEREAEERRYEEAEQDRLLYVAATRAGEQLVVARWPGDEKRSPWRDLYPWIDDHGGDLRLRKVQPPDPQPLGRSGGEMAGAVERVRQDREGRARPTYEVRTVTGLSKDRPPPDAAEEAPPEGTAANEGQAVNEGVPADPAAPPEEYRGLSWGRAVHGALDAAARGARGEALRRYARSVLLEAERPTHGSEPAELEELVELVDRVLESPLWERARAAERTLSEVSFALPVPAGPAGAPRIVEGTVDLAFREADGWVIVDYKTDLGTDVGFARRREGYIRQVDLYATAWAELTGEPVKERVLFFTARAAAGGGIERW